MALQAIDFIQKELFLETPTNNFFTCEEIGKEHTVVQRGHQTVCTTCGLVTCEDFFVATPSKGGFKPEITLRRHPKILGSLIFKKDLECKPGPYKSELKEILQRLKESGTFRVWTPKRIDEAFDNLVAELNGRVPKYLQFREKYPGAMDAIHKKRYDFRITKWSDYVRSRGKNTYFRHWTHKEVDDAFFNLTKELGKYPTSTEFQERFGGPYKMILEGRYSPKIRNWKKFSELMSLYQSFHELKEKLGRTPTYREFEKEFKKIRKLNPKIKTYNHFLEYMGIKPKKICGYWTQEKIKKAYYELKQALKRTPTRREFREKYPGAYSAIRRFNFDSSVKAYNEFLKKMGEVPVRHEKNYWTPERIKEAYHKLMKELGRSPRNTEFQSRYSGAYNAILKGKFDANIKTYKDFVENFKAETVFNASPTIEIDPSRIILVHGHK